MDIDGIIALIQNGKMDEAKVLCSETLRFNSRKGHEAFGYFYLKLKHYDASVIHFLKSLNEGNISDSVFRGLGYAYFGSGNYGEASKYFSRVKEKDVDDYFMLFTSSLMLKDPVSARSYLDMAYDLDPDRTKELMRTLFSSLIAPSTELTDEQKRAVEKRIEMYLEEKAGGGS